MASKIPNVQGHQHPLHELCEKRSPSDADGGIRRLPASAIVPRPDTAWIENSGTAFKHPREVSKNELLHRMLAVWYVEQDRALESSLTDLADQVGVSWYALRFWNLSWAYKAVKSLGMEVQDQRESDPDGSISRALKRNCRGDAAGTWPMARVDLTRNESNRMRRAACGRPPKPVPYWIRGLLLPSTAARRHRPRWTVSVPPRHRIWLAATCCSGAASESRVWRCCPKRWKVETFHKTLNLEVNAAHAQVA